MEAFSSGALAGVLLNTLVSDNITLFIVLLVPTIYYNYKFFKNIKK
jgi:hypothetical protein